MTSAATLSLNWMTDLFAALPDYHEYYSRYAANGDETKFRLALGQQLQVIGQHLLAGSESRVMALGDEQHEIIDLLADDVSDCLKMLNRTGAIQLAADARRPSATWRPSTPNCCCCSSVCGAARWISTPISAVDSANWCASWPWTCRPFWISRKNATA